MPKYKATSETGMEMIFNDIRVFKYGFFAILTEDCVKCENKKYCKKGRTTFEGVSKGTRKSIHICSKAKYKKEIVKLEIL